MTPIERDLMTGDESVCPGQISEHPTAQKVTWGVSNDDAHTGANLLQSNKHALPALVVQISAVDDS